MSDTGAEDEPYASAMDMPSMVELLKQVRGLKAVTRFIGRGQRPMLLELEAEILEFATTVDRFYDLLESRHWIFHDDLNLKKVSELLDLDADAAEEGLISIYRDREGLRFMARRLHGLSAMRPRMDLIEKALDDYEAGRFYATVLVLVTVMDGFVNDVETDPRRGLHSRTPDQLVAWDSVVGHHKGLSHAHKTFTKGFFKTTQVEATELFRNGIVHGTIVNYDNVVVASKAWNRLFAVSDWARSREAQGRVPEPQPTWREIFLRLAANERARRALEAWRPTAIDGDDPSLASEPAYQRVCEYLTAWTQQNYGLMGSMISPEIASSPPSKMAGVVRRLASERAILGFTITRASFEAAAVCEFDVDLELEDGVRPGRMRWIRETADGSPATPDVPATWFLYSWDPDAILDRAREAY